MKLRNLFMAVMAGAAMLVGCNKEVDLGPAKLALDQTTLAFEAAGGSQTVSVTATRDWAVSGVPDWVALSATSGKAAVEAQPVKITVAQNAEYNRSATIVFTIGFARTSLTINQAGPEGEIDNGDGTLENPFNVAGVIEYVNELGADVASPKKVFVAGIISAVDEEFNTQYGNGAFKISDDGKTTGAQFTAYRILYLGNKKFTAGDTQIKVGDEVIIYGNVVNYKGNTPETQQNSAFLYSLNGVDKGGAEGGSGGTGEPKGSGTLEDPFNPAGIAAVAEKLADNAVSEQSYYMKGKISKIAVSKGVDQTFANSGSYGNASFYIADAEDGTGEFYIYQTYYLGNRKWVTGDTDIKVGDEVIVYGPVTKYVSSYGTTLETSGKGASYIYSLNGVTEGGGGEPATPSEPKGTGTVDDPYNPAGANAFIKTLAADTESENDIYVKGIISSVKYQYAADDYGNGTFYITEDGKAESESFYCYRVLYLNNQKFTAGDAPVKVGDEVVVCGKVVNYQGNTPETASNKAYLYSLVPGEGGDPVEPGEDIEGYTIKLTNENTWTAGSDATYGDGFETVVEGIKIGVYKYNSTTAIVTPDQYAARVYKGAVISITAPEGLNMTALQFQASNLNSGQYCKDLTVLEGGSGTIPANLTTYKVGPWTGSANKVVFHTPNAQSRLASVTIAFDGEFNPGGDQPGDDPSVTHAGTLDDPYTVADAIAAVSNLTWTSKTEFDKVGPYYVKGKIASIKYTYSAQYGTATFDISDEGGTDKFTCYSVKYFGGEAWVEGNMQVAVGDEVIIYGELQNYQGNTPETVSGAYVYSLNGKTSDEQTPGGDDPVTTHAGTLEDPFTVADAVASVANLTWTSKTEFDKVGPYYVKGKIASIKYTYSAQYGTATFDISDEGGTDKFTCYSVKYFGGEAWVEGNTQVAVGDEVIIYGELQNYQGNTPETVSGAYVYSINGKTSDEQTPGGDEPVTTHAGTLEDPFTVADAVASVANLTWTSKTEFDKVGPYYVKGKIASIKYTYSAQYGTATFDISDEGGTDKFTCYSVKYFGGEAWVEGNTQVAVGDEVIIYGELQNYQGNTPETVSGAYVYSLNGKTSDDQTPGGEPGGNEPEGGIYASTVTWTLGEKAYSEKAIVNDVENVPVLKLGTSSKIGTATLTIPSGATKITFYAVSWNGNPSKLVFKNGDTELGSVSPAANTGLASSSPYTLTVTEADKYEIAVSGATSITVQTDGSNKRAALFAIVSE